MIYDFPWDLNQALSFALFHVRGAEYRCTPVGNAGFDDTQKRLADDTGILLSAWMVCGFDSDEGKTAIRRINQMHRSHDPPTTTFAMSWPPSSWCPRWVDDHGWRRLTTTR